MSFRTINNSAVSNNVDVVSKTYPNLLPAGAAWVRNPTWPAISTPVGSNRLVGLYAVYPNDSNFFAILCGGDYTINYGDGTTSNIPGGTITQRNYSYSAAALVGTDGPVTFTDSTDTVNRTAHGYTNGMTVQFYNIVSTTGITASQTYFVINAAPNSFQISNTFGGSAVVLTTDGSGTLLPYRIATVTVTPQAGQVLSGVDLWQIHTSAPGGSSTLWLDVSIASPDLAILKVSTAATTIRHLKLEKFTVVESAAGAGSFLSSMFNNCFQLSLVDFSGLNTSTAPDTDFMFNNCYRLQAAPMFNTASVTSMANMFAGCRSLIEVPVYNTALVLSTSTMFTNCASLTTAPLFNLASVTNTVGMFFGATNLKTAPPYNLTSVISAQNMFSGCTTLTSAPFYNVSNATTLQNFFNNCSSLVSVGGFNTGASLVNLSSMFANNISLVSVPLFNTSSATAANLMFSGCSSLQTVPAFNFTNLATCSNMFSNCASLETTPAFTTTSALATISSMFSQCLSLQTVALFNTSGVTNMSSMFTGCSVLQSIPNFNTAAVTNFSSMFTSCLTLTEIPAITVTAPTASSGYSLMFSSCINLSRIQAGNFRFTFSVGSLKLSATALNEIYTNLPVVSGQTITVTGNWGTATDNPAIATAKGWAVTG